MIFTALLYASLTAVTMLTVSVAYRHERWSWFDVPASAAAIFTSYIVSNVIAIGLPVRSIVVPLAIMDSYSLVFFFVQWMVARRIYTLAIMAFLGAEIARHIAYLADNTNDYVLFLNVAYIAQLSCVLICAVTKLMGEKLGRATD